MSLHMPTASTASRGARRFFDAYPADDFVSALSRELSRKHNQTQLPDKSLLQAKLHEFCLQNQAAEGEA